MKERDRRNSFNSTTPKTKTAPSTMKKKRERSPERDSDAASDSYGDMETSDDDDTDDDDVKELKEMMATFQAKIESIQKHKTKKRKTKHTTPKTENQKNQKKRTREMDSGASPEKKAKKAFPREMDPGAREKKAFKSDGFEYLPTLDVDKEPQQYCAKCKSDVIAAEMNDGHIGCTVCGEVLGRPPLRTPPPEQQQQQQQHQQQRQRQQQQQRSIPIFSPKQTIPKFSTEQYEYGGVEDVDEEVLKILKKAKYDSDSEPMEEVDNRHRQMEQQVIAGNEAMNAAAANVNYAMHELQQQQQRQRQQHQQQQQQQQQQQGGGEEQQQQQQEEGEEEQQQQQEEGEEEQQQQQEEGEEQQQQQQQQQGGGGGGGGEEDGDWREFREMVERTGSEHRWDEDVMERFNEAFLAAANWGGDVSEVCNRVKVSFETVNRSLLKFNNPGGFFYIDVAKQRRYGVAALNARYEDNDCINILVECAYNWLCLFEGQNAIRATLHGEAFRNFRMMENARKRMNRILKGIASSLERLQQTAERRNLKDVVAKQVEIGGRTPYSVWEDEIFIDMHEKFYADLKGKQALTMLCRTVNSPFTNPPGKRVGFWVVCRQAHQQYVCNTNESRKNEVGFEPLPNRDNDGIRDRFERIVDRLVRWYLLEKSDIVPDLTLKGHYLAYCRERGGWKYKDTILDTLPSTRHRANVFNMRQPRQPNGRRANAAATMATVALCLPSSTNASRLILENDDTNFVPWMFFGLACLVILGIFCSVVAFVTRCVRSRQSKRLGEDIYSSYAFLIRRKNSTAITCSHPGPQIRPEVYGFKRSRGSTFLAKKYSNAGVNKVLANKRSDGRNKQIRYIVTKWIAFANYFNELWKKVAIVPHRPSTESLLEFFQDLAMEKIRDHATMKNYAYQINQWLLDVNGKDKNYKTPMQRNNEIQNYILGLKTLQYRKSRRKTVRSLPPSLVKSLFQCSENWFGLFRSLTLKQQSEFCFNSEKVTQARDLFACALNCWIGFRPSSLLTLLDADVKCLEGSVFSMNASNDKVRNANEVLAHKIFLEPSNSDDSIHARLKEMAKTWITIRKASDVFTRKQLGCAEKSTGFFFIPLFAKREGQVQSNRRCTIVTRMLQNALSVAVSKERLLLKDIFQNVDANYAFTGYSLRKAVASNMWLCGIPLQHIEAHIGWSKRTKTCEASYIDRSVSTPANRQICAKLYADLKSQYANANSIQLLEEDEDEARIWTKKFYRK